jgi:hypothetical protein
LHLRIPSVDQGSAQSPIGLDLDSGVHWAPKSNGNRTPPWTRSGSGVQSKSDSPLDSGCWCALLAIRAAAGAAGAAQRSLAPASLRSARPRRTTHHTNWSKGHVVDHSARTAYPCLGRWSSLCTGVHSQRGCLPASQRRYSAPGCISSFDLLLGMSECMPDFVMCYKDTKNVFEIARGFLAVVINNGYACCRQDGVSSRTGDYQARHFTYCHRRRCIFVFDVLASDWAAVLAKLGKWLVLIGCFGQAAYTTAKLASALPLTDQVSWSWGC